MIFVNRTYKGRELNYLTEYFGGMNVENLELDVQMEWYNKRARWQGKEVGKSLLHLVSVDKSRRQWFQYHQPISRKTY